MIAGSSTDGRSASTSTEGYPGFPPPGLKPGEGALPHIARAHVSRWGDGSAHLHVFFARPAGFPQLRGTCLALWDDLLPAVPDAERAAAAAAVARALAAAHGGETV